MRGCARIARLLGAVILLALVPLSGGARAAGKSHVPVRPAGLPDPKVLDELAQDMTRFADEVKGYRTAANGIIKRTYADKLNAIRGQVRAADCRQ